MITRRLLDERICRRQGHTFSDPRYAYVRDVTCERCGLRRVLEINHGRITWRRYIRP